MSNGSVTPFAVTVEWDKTEDAKVGDAMVRSADRKEAALQA